MKNYLKNLFSSSDDASCKRVAGMIGWLACIVICIYCTFAIIEAPSIIEWLFVCSTGLLGLETIFGVFKKGKFDKSDKNNNHENNIQ